MIKKKSLTTSKRQSASYIEEQNKQTKSNKTNQTKQNKIKQNPAKRKAA
jgi:hypothetical protein